MGKTFVKWSELDTVLPFKRIHHDRTIAYEIFINFLKLSNICDFDGRTLRKCDMK